MLEHAAVMVFVPVSDVAAARRFYVGTLGFTVTDESPFALVVDANGTMMRLTPVPDFQPQPFTVVGWSVPDISATVEALASLGVTFTRYDSMEQDSSGIWEAPGGDRVASFTDPDGNTLSLTTFASPLPA
jgi:catechol 2,3-dioxygenase-like lactoylglutathione lyase family enzyme